VRPRFAKLTYMPNAMPTISATASVRSSYDLIDRAAFLKRIVRTGNMDSNVGATDCETGWFTDDVTGLTDAIIVTTFRKNKCGSFMAIPTARPPKQRQSNGRPGFLIQTMATRLLISSHVVATQDADRTQCFTCTGDTYLQTET
jgi:hypothetical protein